LTGPHRAPSFERHRAAVRARLLASGQPRAGAGSISWRINRERVVVAGWGRAILLQLAHPSVAAGVDAHSAFRGSLMASLARLNATVRAMLSLTFGGTDEMIATAAGINTIHDRVRGRDGAGCPYSAHDPELLRWVHATLLESIPLVYDRLIARLTADERDQYCAEAAIMEPLLGMPHGWLPRTSRQLDDYIRDTHAGGTIVVTDASRALARAVLYPPQWQSVWPAFRPVQLLTIGTLPPSIREAYGFPWTPTDERALTRWTAFIQTSLRGLPNAARAWSIARRGEGSATAAAPAAPAPALRSLP
jgi:uncharacterized protein (DUF2236 family)